MESDVRCPKCGASIVDVRRTGHGRPTGWMCPHPTKPDAVLAFCATCAKVWTLPGMRLVVFKPKPIVVE